jgi:hypothetical protein
MSVEENALDTDLDLPEQDEFGSGILTTAFNSETEEVKEMLASDKWMELAIYEFMQNQVSYGDENEDTPELEPRTFIEYEGGDRDLFDGTRDFSTEDKKVVAVEFVNYGDGFSPWHFLGMRNFKKRADGLGKHGRGMKIAAAALAEKGMNLSILSNFEGRSWSGNSFVKSAFRDKFPFLNLAYAFDPEEVKEQKKTVIRVEKPSKEFLHALARMPQKFLHANPKYPGAKLIPEDKREPVQTSSFKLDKGEVRHLRGIAKDMVKTRVDPKYCFDFGHVDFIYVDKLRFDTDPVWGTFAAAWEISGLSEAYDKRLRIDRSKDSTRYVVQDIEFLMGTIVRNIEDERLMEDLIRTVKFKSGTNFFEFSASNAHKKIDFPEANKKLVLRVWERLYPGENCICDDRDKAASAKTDHPELKHDVVYVGSGLYSFLKEAGVQTMQELSKEKSTSSLPDKKLKLKFAGDEKALYKLMEIAVKEDFEVKLERSKDGTKQLSIYHTDPTYKAEDLNSETESSVGKVMQIAAAISSRRNLKLETVAIDEDSISNVRFNVYGYGTAFNVSGSSSTFDRSDRPEYSEFKAGTYLTLKGPDIDNLRDPLDEDEFMGALKKMRARLASMPIFNQNPDNEGMGLPDLFSDRDFLFSILRGMGINIDHLERNTGIAVSADTGFRTATDIISYIRAIEGLDLKESVLPVGYYPKNISNTINFNEVGGTATWENLKSENFDIEIPEREVQDYSAKLVYSDIKSGRKTLMVPEGDMLCGFKVNAHPGSTIKFMRDSVSGMYSIEVKGILYNLTCYTEKDKDGFSAEPPTEKDQVNLIGTKLPDKFNAVQATSLEVLRDAWADAFTYSGENPNIVASNLEEYAYGLLNEASGNCSHAATGSVILDRAFGIASRMCGGYLVQKDGSIATHGWKRARNGEAWISMDPQGNGVKRKETSVATSRPGMVNTGKLIVPAAPRVHASRLSRLKNIASTTNLVRVLVLAAAAAAGRCTASESESPEKPEMVNVSTQSE